jgi:hypothetical protein
MKTFKKYFNILCALTILNSCSNKDRNLGGNFILYKGDVDYPLSVGLNLGDGGVQGLLDGDFLRVGYNELYVTVQMRNNDYYYIEKLVALKKFGDSKDSINGPFTQSEFTQIAKKNELPLPVYLK